jgi:hypothetical protein
VTFTGELALVSASGLHGGRATAVVVGPAAVVVPLMPVDADVPLDPGVEVPRELEPPLLHAPETRAAASTGAHARRLIDEPRPDIGLIP